MLVTINHYIGQLLQQHLSDMTVKPESVSYYTQIVSYILVGFVMDNMNKKTVDYETFCHYLVKMRIEVKGGFKKMVHEVIYPSPLGNLLLKSNEKGLLSIQYLDTLTASIPETLASEDYALQQTCQWLTSYFSGQYPVDTPPLALAGTPFQLAVWKLLYQIPYGETVTYGELAKEIAKQQGMKQMSAQAIGGAVGRNPVPIIVPCHRVLGKNGQLTGYSGGLDKKVVLLGIEGIYINR